MPRFKIELSFVADADEQTVRANALGLPVGDGGPDIMGQVSQSDIGDLLGMAIPLRELVLSFERGMPGVPITDFLFTVKPVEDH